MTWNWLETKCIRIYYPSESNFRLIPTSCKVWCEWFLTKTNLVHLWVQSSPSGDKNLPNIEQFQQLLNPSTKGVKSSYTWNIMQSKYSTKQRPEGQKVYDHKWILWWILWHFSFRLLVTKCSITKRKVTVTPQL